MDNEVSRANTIINDFITAYWGEFVEFVGQAESTQTHEAAVALANGIADTL